MNFQAQALYNDVSPQNTKYIVYKNHKYPVDYDLLKRNSDFFRINDKIYSSCKEIPILEEEGEYFDFPQLSIQEFINHCQNQKIEINPSNIFHLQYLSKKYEVQKLKTAIINIISENKEQLALESLVFILQMNQNKEKTFIETGEEEDIISQHFDHFIKDEKIFQIPLPILYRIIKKYYTINHSKSENEKITNDDFADFLFKLLDTHKAKASIFFEFFDINKNRGKYLVKLHDCYSDVFDTNFLNASLFDTTVDIVKEMAKLKEEYSKELSEMKKISEEQRIQISKIKQEIEKSTNEQNQILLNDINELKKQIDQMKDQTNSYKLWQKIQSNQLGNIEYLIPIGKEWKQGENANIFNLNDNNINYEVSASSTYSSNYLIPNLFDGKKETNIDSWATVANDLKAFLQVKFSIPVVVNVLAFTARSAADQTPTIFEFLALNNQNRWISLGSFSQDGWVKDDVKVFAFFNEQPYTTYKINFYKSNSQYVALAELNLGKIIQ